MKKFYTLSCFLISLLSITFVFAQERNCSTMENLEYRMQKDPGLEQRMNQIEMYTQNKAAELLQSKVNGDIITIPVVVHIIYSNSQQNISVAQIQSQIDVLNEDFRRTNSDANNVWSQAADMQIEFCLASVDPNGNATNGITRKSSSRGSWGTNNAIKNPSQGGVAPWNTSQYLNMWVGNIGGGILGYAQFPGGAASTDGIVMSPQYFGSSDKGSGFFLSAPFDKGRTTTHEVGHFLNLRHIWGDGGCGVDDFVSDTPSSDASNGGCRIGHVSCGSVDMVQNYMDYSDDACMNLFTNGQKARMRATLLAGGIRRSLALSDKCGSTAPTPTCNDGIQNGNETGIDCGGSCQPCGGSSPNIPIGSVISLQGNNGKYVSSENGGSPMNCNRNVALSWEKFTVVDAGGGKIALQGNNGKYVSSENGGSPMNCNRGAALSWEKFTVVDAGGGAIALQGNNGKYVSSENGNGPMNCNRNAIGSWEKFNLTVSNVVKAETLRKNTDKVIAIFPNPTRGMVNIKFNKDVGELSAAILDLSGRVVLKKKLAGNALQTINITALPKGIYILRVTGANINEQRKLVFQ